MPFAFQFASLRIILKVLIALLHIHHIRVSLLLETCCIPGLSHHIPSAQDTKAHAFFKREESHASWDIDSFYACFTVSNLSFVSLPTAACGNARRRVIIPHSWTSNQEPAFPSAQNWAVKWFLVEAMTSCCPC